MESRTHYAIPIHEIATIGTIHQAGGLLRQSRVGMRITWSGGDDEWTSEHDNASQLIAAAQAAVQGKAAAQQTRLTADAVTQLGSLVDEGLLTPQEFERAKAGFVGRPVNDADAAVALLRHLHDLRRAGALSESEFNMKKWDILSRR